MKIVHITNLSNNRSSGMVNVVPFHIFSQSKLVNIQWINLNESYTKDKKVEIENQNIKYNKSLILKFIEEADLVIFHGVYFWSYYKISRISYELGIPYIIVPHGSLTSASISQKKLKKKIGFILFLNNFLKKASAIQFLTHGEYESSSIVHDKKSFVIPNGCEIPLIKKEDFSINEINAIFIGRKSIYYKGLDTLIESCRNIKDELIKNNFKITLYGPNENKSDTKLLNLIKKYKLEDILFLQNAIYGIEKEKIILDSDLFILTSRTEGHPVALIEALSYGVPCLTTKGSNMAEEINNSKAGWGVNNDQESISNGLIEVIKNRTLLKSFGNNARTLSIGFEWDKVADIAIDHYRRLLSK